MAVDKEVDEMDEEEILCDDTEPERDDDNV